MYFSLSVTAVSIKPCIVIFIDILLKPCSLTYVSRFFDFVKKNVVASCIELKCIFLCSSDSCKHKTLHRNCP